MMKTSGHLLGVISAASIFAVNACAPTADSVNPSNANLNHSINRVLFIEDMNLPNKETNFFNSKVHDALVACSVDNKAVSMNGNFSSELMSKNLLHFFDEAVRHYDPNYIIEVNKVNHENIPEDHVATYSYELSDRQNNKLWQTHIEVQPDVDATKVWSAMAMNLISRMDHDGLVNCPARSK